MASFNRMEVFSEDLSEKVHDLDLDTFKVYATNAAPNVATHAVKGDVAEITAENDYPSGGSDVQNATSRTGAVTSMTGEDVTWTADGGPFGPFRYVMLYNDTPTSPADPLAGYWDYGSAVTVQDGEDFVNDFGASLIDVGG